ncbi:MAG: hypothetical protein Q9163_005283, partial [Psora crenata]
MAPSIDAPQVPSEEIYESTLFTPPNEFSSDVNQPQIIAPLNDVKPVFVPGRSFILAFISICIITLAAALDATSLSIALPIITERLKGTAIQAFWSGTSFLVTSAVFQPVIGGLSHAFGRKQLILVIALLFAVGSLVAALATNFTMIWAIWIAWGTTTLGFGLLYLLDPDTSVVAFIFLNVPVSIGTGMAFTSTSLAVQAAGRPQDAGHSVTFYSFIRVFGQSLGVAIGGVVFQNQMRTKLSEYPLLAPLADEYSRDATALVSLIHGMEAGTEKTQLIKAYADSIKMIWVVMATLSATIFTTSIFVKGYSLDQEHKTLQGLNYGDGDKGLEKDQSVANCQ